MFVTHARVSLALTWPIAAGVWANTAVAQSPATPAYAPSAQVWAADRRRPLDNTPRAGVSYRDGRGFRSTWVPPEPRRHVHVYVAPSSPRPAVWTGIYGGLDLGYGRNESTLSLTGLGPVRASGPFGGAHIGFNWQTGAWVTGLEADIATRWMEGQHSFASGLGASTRNDWSTSVRGRLGYAVGSAMLYATGGIAFSGQELALTDPRIATLRTDTTLVGFVAGGGIAWRIAPHVSLRGEVLHYGYRDKAVTMTSSSAIGIVPLRNDETVLRAGLSFHFD
jgi:outer membrane immunogenic protein